MAEDKPRLARLTSILTQLQSKSLVTASDIAERHNISIRTVYRDIRTLEKSGVPVFMQDGKGYSLVKGYTLPPVMFTENEANALITAQQLIQKNKDRSLVDHHENAVLKIKSVLKYTEKEKLDLLSSRMQIRTNDEGIQSSNYLIDLQSAITNYRLVKIKYRSLEDEESQREIEPFALYTTQNNWVLIAFCKMRNDFRSFRLDRIVQLILKENRFEPHQITLQQYFEECRKKYQTTPDIPLT